MIYLLAPLKYPIIPLYTGIERLQAGYGGVGFFIKHTVSFQLHDLCPSNASHVTFGQFIHKYFSKEGPTIHIGNNI